MSNDRDAKAEIEAPKWARNARGQIDGIVLILGGMTTLILAALALWNALPTSKRAETETKANSTATKCDNSLSGVEFDKCTGKI